MQTADCPAILNVSGDAAARRVRTEVLWRHRFAAEEAGDAETAARLISEKHIEVVLLDAEELCRRLRSQFPLLRVVYIGETAAPGADACISEPLDPSLLKEILRRSPGEPVVARAVGGMLADMAADYLEGLQTCAAVFEKNGDTALKVVYSEWCRLLDGAGRRICRAECWRASRESIETGQPVDTECAGSLRLYAVPVFANGEAVGSMNFAYGDPPRDPARLAAIADKFGVNVDDLRRKAEAHVPQAPAVVDSARKRMLAAARLAGAMVARTRAEEAARQATERVARLHRMAAALSKAVTAEQVLDAIAELILEASGAEGAVLALRDGEREPAAARTAGSITEAAARCAALAEAVRSGEAVFDQQQEDGLVIAALPLPVGQKAIGSLGLSFRAPCRLEPDDREFLMALARQCAQALERARLHDAERRVRVELAAQARRMLEVAAGVPAPILVCAGPDHVVEFSNPANLGLWGVRDAAGRPLREAFPEVESAGYAALWDKVFRSGQPCQVREARLQIGRGSGNTEERYFDLSLLPRRDGTGAMIGVLSFSVEVTAQVLARRQLESQRSFFSTVLNQMPLGVVIAEEGGRPVFVNREAQRVLGTDLPAHLSSFAGHPVAAALERAAAGETTSQDEVRCAPPSPTPYVSLHAAPIRGAEGQIVAAVCAFQDVAARRNAQDMLRQQAQMINLSHDAIITATPGHVITGWNEGAVEVYGWTAAEALGRKTYELIGKGTSIAEIDASLKRDGRWDGVLHNYRRDGAPIIVESRQVLVRGGDGEPVGILKINRDVTAREQAMEALRESEEWRKFTQKAAGIGIVDWDLRNGSAKYSGQFFSLYGVDAAALEPTTAGWLRLIHPDDRGGVRRRLEAALAKGEPFEAEFRVMRPDGEIAWLAVKGAVFPGKDGKAERAIAAHMDVTARKRAEEAHYGAQKLESIGLLAGGVAHDFNNLLTTVLGNASLLLQQVAPAARHNVKSIIAGSERGAELTRQLLAYAGKAPFRIEDADLSALVREMVKLVRLSVPKSTELRLNLAENLPAVKTDTGQLQQVIMNLVLNAAEAIGEAKGGMVTITTAARRVNGRLAVRPGEELSPGLYCCLEVNDNGCGMDAATAARVFDPFFSTKFLGRGLGLAAVAGIMRSHRGAITVRTLPGRGSTFTAFFPAARGTAPVQRKEAARDDPRGAGTVLVVDDEDDVRQFVARALQQYGYRTLEAANGEDALALIERRPEIGIVLLDVVMPVMGGGEAIAEIKRRRPDLPVLVTSGYNEAEAQRLCAPYGDIQFIQKPYGAAELAARVKAVMSR